MQVEASCSFIAVAMVAAPSVPATPELGPASSRPPQAARVLQLE